MANGPCGAVLERLRQASAEPAALTVDGETLTLCTGKVQTLSTGETVKIWLVTFVEDTAAEHTYTVHADSAQATVDVSVTG